MSNASETKEEVKFIRDEMKNNLSIRTTLLTFCFTSVITILGFGLTHYDEIPFIIYLIPIIITITFSCRITYYKDMQSRMNAYLRVKHKNTLSYEIIYENNNDDTTNIITNNFCLSNKFTSFIINKELLVLSIVPSIVYYIRFLNTMQYNNDILFLHYFIKNNKCVNLIYLILPLVLCVLEYKILQKVPSYTEKTNEYIERLERATGQNQ